MLLHDLKLIKQMEARWKPVHTTDNIPCMYHCLWPMACLFRFGKCNRIALARDRQK